MQDRNGNQQTTNRPLGRYLSEVGRHPPISREAGDVLARHNASGIDSEAFEKLVKIAYKYRSYGLPIEDLVQEGNHRGHMPNRAAEEDCVGIP